MQAFHTKTLDQTKYMKNILILDANQRSALAATRSLGKQPGLIVFTADSEPRALAGSSCFSKQQLIYPSPNKHPLEFIDSIIALTKAFNISYIQPMTEVSSRLLCQNKHKFTDCTLPFDDYQKILAVSDKCQLMKTAQKLSIPIPETQYFNRLTDWDYKKQNSFPIIIKPALSRIFTGEKWIETIVRKVESRSELIKIVQQDLYLCDSAFMVQEFIDGHGAGVFALYKNGDPICHFAHQRLREKPPSGGVSVFSQSVDVEPISKKYSDLLLNDYSWSGVAMIEFRICKETGTPYLMEINTRFWGSLQLSIDAGINFPALLYNVMTNTNTPIIPSSYKSTRLRWFLGDLDNLIINLKNKTSIRNKLRHIIRFISYHHNTKNEIFRLEDPWPAWIELKQYIRNFVK